MNKEERELLIKDLCGRLPYGVKICDIKNHIMNLIYVNGIVGEVFISYKTKCRTAPIEDIKPYLIPLWRMTKKQKEEFDALYWEAREKTCNDFEFKCVYSGIKCDWFNKNHFDYRGLIRKGLAIDCTDIDVY